MSKVVDERIVEMRFDNKQFESNVSQSMSTLQKLKQSLNLKGASQGLNDLNSAAKNVDMGVLGRGVETVSAKFSAMQVVAMTALMNITNSAVNAGKRIISALTIDPVKTGFQEYETKINAVQTILSNTSNKGTTMSDVTKTLDELNLYADKTIYNFAEMTRNIGTFTAAGVGLKESASAIQGIANLAAASGSSSQQASTAMYQLSQALASGTVKLMDWNSVVNAGMGGQKFQEALKATAREHGIAVDELIKKHGSFRESLQEGWISADILNETLSKFTVDGAQKYAKAMMESGKWTQEQADALIKEARSMEDAATKVKTFTQLWDTLKESAQSGWSQTWEIIIGDFEKARGRLTEVSNIIGDIINESANRRNDLLEGALTSKWDILVKKLNSAGIEAEGFQNKIIELSGTHKEEFQKMIDESDTFEEAVKKALSAGIIDKSGIKEALVGITDEFSKLSDEELKNKGYTEEQIKALRDLAGQAEGTGGSIDDLINNIDRASGAELIWDSLLNILKTIIAPIKAIQKAWDSVFPPNPEGIYNTIKAVKEFTDGILKAVTASGTLEKITRIFKGIFSVVDIVLTLVKDLAGGFIKIVGSLTGFSGEILNVAASFGDFLSNVRNGIKESNIFGKAINKVVGYIVTFINKIKEFNLLGKVIGLIGICINKLKEFGTAIKKHFNLPDFKVFLNFFKSLASFISDIGSNLGTALGSIGTTLMNAFNNIDVSKMLSVLNSGLSAGVLVAIRNYIKGITNPFEETKGFFDKLKEVFNNISDSVTNVLDGVRGSLEAYQNNLKADTLLKIASAVGILALSLTILSSIDSESLLNATGAITALFGELVGAMALLEKINSSTSKTKAISGVVGSLSKISSSIQMMGLTVAVLILAGAMKILSTLDWEGIEKGLVGVAGLVGILVAAAKLMDGNSKSITKFSGQMILMSVAVGILTIVAKQLASMTWKELGKAGAGIFGMIAMLVAAAKIMDSDSKSITKFAGQMILMSVAVGILTIVARQLASMTWEELGKAGSGIFGMIAMLVAASKIMDNDGKSITKFSGQMILMSVAVGILTIVAKQLASMTWKELGKAGAGIFGMIAMLVAAAKIMDSDSKSITKFAGQMILMSVAIAMLTPIIKTLGSMSIGSVATGLIAMGGALLILSVGLKSMNGSLLGSAALLVAAGALAIITPVLKTLGSMSLGSIVKSLIAIAGAFVVFGIAGAILTPLLPVIIGLGAAFALLGIGMLGIGAGLALVGIGLTTLSVAGTAAASSFVAMIGIIVTGIIKLIPAIATAFEEAFMSLIEVVANVAPQLAESLLQLISSVLKSMATHIPEIANSLLTLIIGLINVLAQRAPELIGSIVKLVVSLIDGLIPYIDQIIGAIVRLLSAIVQGIADILGPIINEIIVPLFSVLGTIISGIMQAIAPYLPELCEAIVTVTQTICDAVVKIVEALAPYIPNIESIILTICNSFNTLITNIAPVIDSISNLIRQLGDTITQILGGISTTVSTIGDAICEVFNSLSDTISTACSGITEVLGGLSDVFDSAFGGVSDVIDSVGGAIEGFLEGIADIIDSVGEAALNCGTGFDKLANGIVKITNTKLSDMSSSLAAVATGLGDIAVHSDGMDKAGDGFKNIADSIKSSSSSLTLFNTLITGIKLGLSSLTTYLSTAGATFTKFGSSITTAINGGLLSGTSQILSTVSNLVTSISTAMVVNTIVFRVAGVAMITGLNMGLSSGIPQVISTIVSLLTTISAAMVVNTMLFVIMGRSMMMALNMGLTSGSSQALSTVTSLMTQISMTIIAKQGILLGAGLGLMRGLQNGISAGGSNVITVLSLIVSRMAITVMYRTAVFIAAGYAMMAGFANSLRAGIPLALVIITSMLTVMTVFIKSRVGIFKLSGVNLINALITGIKSRRAQVMVAAKSVLSGAVTSIRTYYSNFKEAGKYLGDGLIYGMQLKSNAVYWKGYELGKAAAKGVKAGAQEKSPSKLTKQYGIYIGEGLIVGMSETLGAVYRTGKEMGESAATSIFGALNGISDAANLDYEPTIRPVVDLNDLQNGGKNLQIGAEISSRLLSEPVNTLQNIVSNAQANIDASNAKVINAINGLRNDLNAFYEADDKEIALYMDSRKVASTIAKPMNRELNILAKRGAY